MSPEPKQAAAAVVQPTGWEPVWVMGSMGTSPARVRLW